MTPILCAKREEGQGGSDFNLQRARALLAPTHQTAGVPQVSSHRHKRTTGYARSTAAAAGPRPEGAVVMVRRDHALDKVANAETQQGEKYCRHFPDLVISA